MHHKPALAIFKGNRSTQDSEAARFSDGINSVSAEPRTALLNYQDAVFEWREGNLNISLSAGQNLNSAAKAFYLRDYYGFEYERNAIARFLQLHNVPVYNSDLLSNQAISKLEQMVIASLSGLPVPDGLYCAKPDTIIDRLNFPAVIKSITGSNGELNFLVDRLEQVQKVFEQTGHKFIVQEYIENDGDYRVVMMYGRPVITYRRIKTSHDSHLNNVAQGAKRELAEDADVIELAAKISKIFKREFCGIDIIKSKTGRLYFLECNFNAGMHLAGDGIDELYFKRAAELIAQINR